MRIIQILLGAVLIVQTYALARPQPGRFVSGGQPGDAVILDTATGHWCAPSSKMANPMLPECRR